MSHELAHSGAVANGLLTLILAGIGALARIAWRIGGTVTRLDLAVSGHSGAPGLAADVAELKDSFGKLDTRLARLEAANTHSGGVS